jgi:hypothetical protein
MNSQITWELVDYLLELLDEADIPTRLSEDEYVLPAKDGWTIRAAYGGQRHRFHNIIEFRNEDGRVLNLWDRDQMPHDAPGLDLLQNWCQPALLNPRAVGNPKRGWYNTSLRQVSEESQWAAFKARLARQKATITT